MLRGIVLDNSKKVLPSKSITRAVEPANSSWDETQIGDGDGNMH